MDDLSKYDRLLGTLKETNNFELNQIDKHIQKSQSLFIVIGIYLGTSFLSLNSSDIYICVFQGLLLFSLFFAIYFSFPFPQKSKREYTVSPDLDYMVESFSNEKYNDLHLKKWLIKIYLKSTYNNREKNSLRYSSFRKAYWSLLFSTVFLFFLLIYSSIMNKVHHNNGLHTNTTAIESSAENLIQSINVVSDSSSVRFNR